MSFNIPFFNKSENYLETFGPNISKGLLFGVGINLLTPSRDIPKPEAVFAEWGDLAGHLTIYGTTRVGKTRLMVSMIDQCVEFGHDLLIVEPKGSLGQETLAWILESAERYGRLRDIKYISPMFKDLSASLNPLWGMSNEEIASLIATIVPAKDEFYKKVGYVVTFALLKGLDFLEKAEGSEGVSKLIKKEYDRVLSSGANIIDEGDSLSDPDLASRITNPGAGTNVEGATPPYRSLVTFEDIATFSTQEGIQLILSYVEKITEDQLPTEPKLRAKLIQERQESLAALEEQATKDSGYFGKVATSFKIVSQQLSTGDLWYILNESKINPILDGFKNPNHGQIVIVQPFPLKYKEASDAFVRVFFAMFTAAFGDIGAAGRGFPRKIFLFIDEGGSVMYPGISSLFNKAGGLGLRIIMFTQSFADIEEQLGPTETKIVNDNTNIKGYMRMNDRDSKNVVAGSFGTITTSEAKYGGSKLDISMSATVQETDILLPSDISEMPKQCFILQTQRGIYFVQAPWQPDPLSEVKMPKTISEDLYSRYSEGFRTFVDNEKENSIEEVI